MEATMSFVISFLIASIGASIPMLYASVGTVFSERSGVSNLGLEGVMLMGAVTGFVTAVSTGSLALALLATVAIGIFIGFIYSFVVVTLQANQIVSGLALTILGTGLSGFLGASYGSEPSPVSFGRMAIPYLSDIPFIGPILFDQDIFTYAIMVFIPLGMIYMYRTRAGLMLRACGENPAAVDSAGGNVRRIRYLHTMFSCMMTALGGSYLTLCFTSGWQENITAGKGWIAVAIVIFSTWNPLKAAGGSLLFGCIVILTVRLQVLGIDVPIQFVNMLPYVCTVVVLIFTTGNFRKKQSISPAALGEPFDREDR
jgi:simple sugar transport system permease protein